MTTTLCVAIAQLNLTVGDFDGNVEKVLRAAARARDELGCRIVLFPELTLTGYPPEDLLLRPAFADAAQRALDRLLRELRGIAAVVGHPLRRDGRLFNAASVIDEGRVKARYLKHLLPNYGVFDEMRYFSAGSDPCVVDIDGVSLGVTICEDVWEEGPVELAVRHGARLILNLNASPFHINKPEEREQVVVAHRARRMGVPIVYANLVGGQDELVFDGSSFVVDGKGTVTTRCPSFVESIVATRFEAAESVTPAAGVVEPLPSLEERVYAALVLGIRDYISKNRFSGVVLGLSGGVDSALTLALAVDAIGAQRVEVLVMPSRYTREMSVEDALAEARALGVHADVIPIEPMFEAFLEQLQPLFEGLPADATEENIQARCRGILLMAVSNKTGKIVLTTGNKSEMAVGYATLYGDMAGGFAAIKDVPKTLVYRLARYRNTRSAVIPQRVIDRPPSAELAPDQLDADTLPPYEVLDAILEAYVEEDRSPEEIAAAGFDAGTVERVVKMVDRNEYKRRQAAPGVRITQRAFGRDRRYPITSAYRHGVEPALATPADVPRSVTQT